jgi:DNA-directed RNA polymerase subunit beta
MTAIGDEIVLKRKCFSKKKSSIGLPNLIEVQSRSFNDFVQIDALPEDRENIGIEKVFRDIFPIEYNDSISLVYSGYELGVWSCACSKLQGIRERYSWTCSQCGKSGCSQLDDEGTCSFCKKASASYKTCSDCLIRVKLKPPFTPKECLVEGQSYTLPLKVTLQLITWQDEDGVKKIKDVKEQKVFFLDLPIMIDVYEDGKKYYVGKKGIFIINGINRVVVSQIHRSPGVIFSLSKKSKDNVVNDMYCAKIIPMRGSWIDFEVDNKDLLYVRVDKTKKVLATTFLQALGITRESIATLFYRYYGYFVKNKKIYLKVDEFILGMRIELGMIPAEYNDFFLNKVVTSEVLKRLLSYDITLLSVDKNAILNKYLGSNVVDQETGEVIVSANTLLVDSVYEKIIANEGASFLLITSAGYVLNPIIHLTLQADKCDSVEAATRELYLKMFPGELASFREMQDRIANNFFNSKFYDLTKVGRVKINRKLGLDISDETLTLTKEDLIATIRYLVVLREQGEGEIDDIDHLGNRRVRLVGELLSNQLYSGMLKVERIVRERFRMHDANKSIAPYDLINAKPVMGVIREFFSTGQLSQFLDQTNPLSELAHKRRLSSLGPGGVLKDRATYEVRDVHTSHYGRICPIETPEGQAIGLISSLATLSLVNDLGFIETPYHPVVNGEVKKSVVHIDAFKEANIYIAQMEFIKGNKLTSGKPILARYQGDFVYTDQKNIQYVDVSPNQLFSVATALIPFLQHDDAVRALMGSNMQRQAVPLFQSETPVVGTGLEVDIGQASRSCYYASEDSIVEYVSADKIILRIDRSSFSSVDSWLTRGIEVHDLEVFKGSSYNTLIHQKPIVRQGEVVKKGQVLTNASAVKDGELALGTNLLVAYMPWDGYNYEDAIVLSQRVVEKDLLTSVHITQYSVDARETRLGPEEITRDIPSISDAEIACLDEDGIVKVGTRVKAGDILVGKVTLKGDSQSSPEEKLLRAIFGEKSKEVRDTSLRVPAGVEGFVTNIEVFSRSGIRKDPRYKAIMAEEAIRIKKDFFLYQKALERMVKEGLYALTGEYCGFDEHEYLQASLDAIFAFFEQKKYQKNKEVQKIITDFRIQLKVIHELEKEKLASLRSGDSLPSGVLKMVRVDIATIRRAQVGDKIAGRHGNKGVVSLILPQEDMPFMKDGTPVDVVLNPLGVPSRMNLGQILEMILGYCGKEVGKNMADALEQKSFDYILGMLKNIFSDSYVETALKQPTGREFLKNLARYIAKNNLHFSVPIFNNGSFEKDIIPFMEKNSDIGEIGAHKLRDGRTGEYFDQKVTVGVMYIIKLNHMVDDKLHARSVGPYSLVTQQPLGGKAQEGGQRFGEMEVWALEAYGASATLQELLTQKSDDITGRHKTYDAIVRGEAIPEPGLPESFNVLVKELQSLGLELVLLKADKES